MLINIGDVVDGALVSAIAVAGRRISVAVDGLRGRRRLNDLTAARWFETYRMASEAPGLPELPAALTERLAEVLRGEEAQAALHELLATRLTDAPEADATAARQVLVLTLTTADARAAQFAEALAGYYDDQVCALVARLKADDPPLLAQIRSEAFSTRMINILNAIERHTAALSARPDQLAESRFLASYRRHVIDRHGKLEPPDFDRRRRVPTADIYVPTGISEELPPERAAISRSGGPTSMDVYELAGRLDRSVLLGDPGGGKTTAANVLMHRLALDAADRVPFLVTLREYAAADPPERSVARHIEHVLETFYQCSSPAGLVDLLLLTGRAVVIFDGLDELLDTARRADVTDRVEQFCVEYPLAPALVTSRLVGYDQARLDDRQFTCYRLGGFADDQVAEYARKWFAQDAEARADEADAFLAESEGIRDLRSNPLLLSLMCILYRGEGSLPRDRADVYGQCANLLFRRWDARRRIHQELRAGHLLEPALRHLAWWLFEPNETRTAVTERELITETAVFLRGRGFESQDDAGDAAREFVEFCRGRMWVFSDAGTTATGERLYAFTHRTFLEYFAASQLAYDSDTPEQLARMIAPHAARSQWEIVGELAVQIKDNTSTAGARRVYEELLGERRRRSAAGRSGILQFLARTLRSVDLSPQVIRALTREVLGFFFTGDLTSSVRGLPLAWLLSSCYSGRDVVDQEISAFVAAMVASDAPVTRLNGLRLAVSLDVPLWGSWGGIGPDLPWNDRMRSFWRARNAENATVYAPDIISAATDDPGMRLAALAHDLITVGDALELSGGLLSLLQPQDMEIFDLVYGPYLSGKLFDPARDQDHSDAIRAFAAVGNYLISHPRLPWIAGKAYPWSSDDWARGNDVEARPPHLDTTSYLGTATVLLLVAESGTADPPRRMDDLSRRGPFPELYAYMERRLNPGLDRPLPDLPVPGPFKQVFREWAEGHVNFTEPDREQEYTILARPSGAPGAE